MAHTRREMTPRRAAPPLLKRLPREAATLLRDLGRLADEQGIGLHLVGGVVRDLVLKRSNWDLDLAVEGNGMRFARLVADRYNADLAVFERFATARLTLPGGIKVDVASTRRESYVNPAALPDVQPATLEEDLFRRDFTINAMAIELNAAQWGRLRDPYGGQDDLKAKIVRVLHDRSFVDDPTRIFRGIRFAERFGFHLEPKTSRLLRQAARTDIVAGVSGPRLANEIFLLMQERHPERGASALVRLDLLRFLHPRLTYGKQARTLMAALPRARNWWRRECSGHPVDRSLLSFMALVSDATPSTIAGIVQRLQLSAAQAHCLGWAGERTSRITEAVSRQDPMRPSQVYRLLAGMPDEALVLLMAQGLATDTAAEIRRLKKRLLRFLRHDREMTTTVNGNDLKRLGLKPGPHFKKILDRLLDARIDGTIRMPAEEQELARNLAARYG
jgi:tRNA nucleotidyltransferase (CCA-adding enzyme)